MYTNCLISRNGKIFYDKMIDNLIRNGGVIFMGFWGIGIKLIKL